MVVLSEAIEKTAAGGKEVNRGMAKSFKTKKQETPKQVKRTSQITLSGTDLSQLARLVAGGKLLLQQNYPVVARLKAALTRMGLPVPEGL